MTDGSTNDEKIAQQLEHFAERLNLVFAYFFCALEFEDDEDSHADPGMNDRAWAMKTIQNACLHTSLVALRDLDDFFAPRTKNSRPDDLKASDFGYPGSLTFLVVSERKAIDKVIVHSTLPGSEAGGSRWDIFDLATKCVKQSDRFLDWTEKRFVSDAFLTWTAAVFCRHKTKAIYGYVARAVEARRRQEGPTP